MKFEKVNIDDLIPADYNPRKDLNADDNEYIKIKNSIKEFGYVDPIIANADNTVIGGHQRLKVLKDLGYKEIDVVRVDVDKTKEKALNVALNKITGDWDYLKLDDLIEELKLDNFNVDLIGFDDWETIKIDWDTVPELSDNTYEEPTQNSLQCPECQHIDRKENFKLV